MAMERNIQLDYVSTEDSALEILDYIKANCGGKLFAIGGVSLGGQIGHGAFVFRQ